MGTDLTTTGTPMDALDPKQRLVVEQYTNPLLPTFGQKMPSARMAGYGTTAVFETQAVVEAIAWIYGQRAAHGDKVKAFVAAHAMDAAVALVRQLSVNTGLEPKVLDERLLAEPPKPIIGTDKDGNERVIGYDEGPLKLAREVTSYNRAAAALAREQRDALRLILAYHMGTPEQSNRNAGGKDGDDPLDLGNLTDEELRDLARHIQEVRAEKRAEATTVTVLKEEEGETQDG